MAVVTVPEQGRKIEDPVAINEFLAPFGIQYERWPLEERVDPNAPPEAILAAYDPEIQRLMAAGGYVVADVINVTPETPGLDAMLEKFKSEHIHTEDEVRFILKGRGVFHINPADQGPVFAIQVDAGDLINVPKGTLHWFNLCEDRTVRAVRLFQDKTGWTPHYSNSGIHAKYAAVCWGPAFVPTANVESAVRL
jgi:1,2-dihydroxy-3-keto-5-methylthiopentene dioxygenase